MYCSECGKSASGKFCSHCGARLAHAAAVTEETTVPVELVVDWSREVDYKTLMGVTEVREAVERSARLAPKRISGEEFLALADKVVPMGVTLEKLGSIVNSLYSQMGVGMSRGRVARVDAPVGRVMLRTMCSLARHGQSLRHVEQASDGCSFEAALPSDLLSFEGDLRVVVRRVDGVSEVAGSTKVRGQFFDWGKSNRCLDKLFADVERDAA